MIKRILPGLSLLVWFGLLSAPTLHAQESFTLEEAVQYALKESQNIKLSQADIGIANAQIKEYKAQGIPQINGSANYNYFLAIPTQILPDFLGPAVDGRLLSYDLIDPSQVTPPSGAGLPAQFGTRNIVTVGAEASFMLFDAAFFSGLKAVSKAKDLAQKEFEQTEFEIRQNITQAYMLVAYTQKNKTFIDKNLNNIRETRRETQALLNNGFVEQLDLDRLDLSYQNLEIEQEKLDRMLQVAVNLLKFQMDYPLEEEILLTDDLDDLEEKFQLTSEEIGTNTYQYNNRPEYNTIEAGRLLNQLQIENIRSGYYPALRGVASYSAQLFRNDLFNADEGGWFPNSFVGASLSIPIYDGSRRKAQIQQAKLELEKVNVQKRIFERSMDLEVANARENLRNAQSTLTSREKTLSLAERIFETTKIKYQEGVGGTVEMSQAERELYNAQSAYTEGIYDVLNARFDLKKALGNLK